jgi:hypothetical protein
VVLDNLQWADESTLALLRFVARPYRSVPLVVACAYRDDELGPEVDRALAELAGHGEPVQLHGLSQEEVFELVADAVGGVGTDRWAAEVHRRTDGHPFLARQLTELLADPAQPAGAVPPAAHDPVGPGSGPRRHRPTGVRGGRRAPRPGPSCAGGHRRRVRRRAARRPARRGVRCPRPRR